MPSLDVHDVHIKVAPVMTDVAVRMNQISRESSSYLPNIKSEKIPPPVILHLDFDSQFVHVLVKALKVKRIVGRQIHIDVAW